MGKIKLDSLSNEVLENMTCDALMKCLGSESDIMEELDYCESDIKDRRKLEKEYNNIFDILYTECIKRGINIFRKE